jgi:arylsulfatase A-like enzyme
MNYFPVGRAWLVLLTSFCVLHAKCVYSQATDLPNILWITAEDLSPDLGCYGNRYATTPHLDQFAEQGVRYTHAFATAPVCSPARSCLITGVYATSLGTQNLRSEFPIPENIVGFPKFLRAKGYYCTNNV